jgi:hypothetical protein
VRETQKKKEIKEQKNKTGGQEDRTCNGSVSMDGQERTYLYRRVLFLAFCFSHLALSSSASTLFLLVVVLLLY